MSYYDRMGYGGYQKQGPFRGFSFFPPMIKWLFILNIGAWLLFNNIVAAVSPNTYIALREILALMPFGSGFWPWQLVTYQFLHGGFFHLFMNMFVLWIFGMDLENRWGSQRFMTFYLLCGIGGGVAHLIIPPLLGQVAPVVGASGAVLGLLTAFGLLYPNRKIYLYFLLPIPAKWFVLGWIALDLIHGVLGTATQTAHFAHLGGAAVGLVMTLGEMKVLPFGSSWLRFLGEFRNPFSRRDSGGYQGGEPRDAKFYDIRTGKKNNDGEQRVSQEVVDAILDKIAVGGYQSLTDEEKRILNEASRKLH